MAVPAAAQAPDRLIDVETAKPADSCWRQAICTGHS